MSAGAVEKALTRPARALPKARDVLKETLRGVHPGRTARDVKGAAQELWDKDAWRRAVAETRALHSGTGLLDDAGAQALKDLDDLPGTVRHLPVVEQSAEATRRGLTVMRGNTAASALVDGTDKLHQFDGVKPYLQRDLFR